MVVLASPLDNISLDPPVCVLCAANHAGRFVWLSLSAPSVWATEHAELTEAGWGSTQARRLEASYLYIYQAQAAANRRKARLGSRRRRN